MSLASASSLSAPIARPRIEATDATGARHRESDLHYLLLLSGVLADHKEGDRIPAEIRTRRGTKPRKTSSLEREQLRGFCRVKEEFKSVDAVVSYLINIYEPRRLTHKRHPHFAGLLVRSGRKLIRTGRARALPNHSISGYRRSARYDKTWNRLWSIGDRLQLVSRGADH